MLFFNWFFKERSLWGRVIDYLCIAYIIYGCFHWSAEKITAYIVILTFMIAFEYQWDMRIRAEDAVEEYREKYET